MTPLERVATAPKGELKSPYPDFTQVAEEGHRKYMAAGCNGCHGGGGGGGMAAPLTNPVWIYGDDDDTRIARTEFTCAKRDQPEEAGLDAVERVALYAKEGTEIEKFLS